MTETSKRWPEPHFWISPHVLDGSDLKAHWKVNQISKSGDTKFRGTLGRDLLKVRMTRLGRTIEVFMSPYGKSLRVGQLLSFNG